VALRGAGDGGPLGARRLRWAHAAELVHSGFGEDRDAEGYRLGWQAFLVSLRRLVELGDAWRKPEDVDLATR
jgi:hypothetical protein